MGELGGTQKYLYWSHRRVLRLLEDSDVRVPESSQWKVATPPFGNVFPTIEYARSRNRTTKTELARIFQRSFGQRIVSDLSSPAPIKFASGKHPVTFGEFVSPDGVPQRALFYVRVPVERGEPVAVCLFGSFENYAEILIEAGAERGGWTASSAVDIERFLKTGQFEDGVICDSQKDIAREAVKVCCYQGETGTGLDIRRGYNRNFTYGDSDACEWCAEIFFDVDLSADDLDSECDHSRVLVGAPLWVRTPSLRNIYLYSDYTKSELEEKAKARSALSFGARLKKVARRYKLSWTDRLDSLGRAQDQPCGDDRAGRKYEEDTSGQTASNDGDAPEWTRPLLRGEDTGWPRDWAAGYKLKNVWIEPNSESDLHAVIMGLIGYLDRKQIKWEHALKCLREEKSIPEADTQYLRHLHNQGKSGPIEAAEHMVRVHQKAKKLIDDLCRQIKEP